MSSKKPRESKTESRPVPVVQFYYGKGKFVLPNGDIYRGEYCAHYTGLIWREGFGVYKTKDGETYRGHWYNDKLADDRHVKITYPSGVIYKGKINQYQYYGDGVFKIDRQFKVYLNCEENKATGDVLMSDLYGKIWHGVVSEDKVLLSPENQFFTNIPRHRGKIKQRPPVTFPSNTPVSTIVSLAKSDPEEIVFKKSQLTRDGHDFTASSWYKDYVDYKNERDKVLTKIQNHEKLSDAEKEWHKIYRSYKQMKTKKPVRTEPCCKTELLDKFYSKEFVNSSKPYSVFYPSYDWMPKKSPTTVEVGSENTSSFETMQRIQKTARFDESDEFDVNSKEEESEVEIASTIYDDNSDICNARVGTDSLFELIDSVMPKTKRVGTKYV